VLPSSGEGDDVHPAAPLHGARISGGHFFFFLW
jgi:hypothetical protein